MFHTFTMYLGLGMCLLSAAGAYAQEGDGRTCSVRSLSRAYAFRVDGWLGSGSAVTPFAAVGVQTFDGAGRFTATNTVSNGGTVVRNLAFSGTYTVNRDCTGSMIADFGNGLTARADFVIGSNGDELFFISADPQTTYSGTFRRQ